LLCFAVRWCVVLYCAVLCCCVVLCGGVLRCATRCCAVLCYAMLFFVVLCGVVLCGAVSLARVLVAQARLLMLSCRVCVWQFYVDHNTQETHWELPRGIMKVCPASEPLLPAPCFLPPLRKLSFKKGRWRRVCSVCASSFCFIVAGPTRSRSCSRACSRA